MAETFGFDKLEKALQTAINDFPEKVEEALGTVADEVVADTQLNTKVVTGTLKRSWTRDNVKREGNNFSVEVGSNIEYAPHVEYGHKIGKSGFVKGKFYLTNVVKKKEKTLNKDLENMLEEVIRELKL